MRLFPPGNSRLEQYFVKILGPERPGREPAPFGRPAANRSSNTYNVRMSVFRIVTISFFAGGLSLATAAVAVNAEPRSLTAEQDHQRMLDLLGIGTLRRGADVNPASSNAANYDQDRADERYFEAARTATFVTTANGLVVTAADGPAARIRLQAISDAIIRVTAFPDARMELPGSLMVTAKPTAQFEVSHQDESVTLKTEKASATVSIADGRVRFANAAGEVVLTESGRGPFRATRLEGETYYAIRQRFNPGTGEAFYGLGQHQNGQFNFKGEDIKLAQHNLVIAMPFVVSSRNYGVLWDNNAITRFGDPESYGGLDDGGLTVRDAKGRAGGLTARYLVDGDLVATRVEREPDYQFLKDQDHWPPVPGMALDSNTPGLEVSWEGSLEAARSGVHKFRFYLSGEARLEIDGETLVDRWRTNWNPWYENFEIPMTVGEPRRIRIQWRPGGGYLRLLHRPPQTAEKRHSLTLSSELGRAIDYYFVAGDDLYDVLAGYHVLTGDARLLPRWAYGFWQSRERYRTQSELLAALKEYRRRELPIDNIVLDWFYWKEDQWGSHRFDPDRFPDPAGMVDAVHALDAQIMVSVWPKFYPQTDHFKELDSLGHIYRHTIDTKQRDWVGPGYISSFFDPYSAEAREIFWRQIRENLHVLGFDAWWLDATEPDLGSNADDEERKRRMTPTALGPGAAYFNTYALFNSQAVFEGLQEKDPDERVMILTRSGYPGIQRYAAATWSGDTASTWHDLRAQVPAGLNMALSGISNWTFDIGGFTPPPRMATTEPAPGDLAEWRELNVRWFQYGAFAPLFRSHGQYPYRELYNIAEPGTEEYAAMAWYLRLRYRLLPYVYTLAADHVEHHRPMMRALVLDFPRDARVRDIGHQYLFGPALLVSPVTDHRARTWQVYLPEGTDWYDFYSGRVHSGGQEIDADAPLRRIPVFVRAGSIIPVAPPVQHSGEIPGLALTLNVYTGTDGAFDLYEDDGETYAYRRGQHSRIPLRYDHSTGTLTLGKRRGGFPGMAERRTFHIRWIDPPTAADARPPPDADEPASRDHEEPAGWITPVDATIVYSGRRITLTRHSQ